MTPKPTDIAHVVDLFQRTMHLPDPGVVYLVLATVAANRLPGDPLWILIVGPASSGKTEALNALSDLPECHSVSTFTVPGLLSGSTKEGITTTKGLLPLLTHGPNADQGMIVASDFGTLLSEHSSTRNSIFATLRETYDGKVIRYLNGVPYVWAGKAGFLGATTTAVDSTSVDMGVLGERFTYYRIPDSTPEDEFNAGTMALENAGRQREIRAERSRLVAKFFAGRTLPDELPALTRSEEDRLITLAGIGSRCRSSVVRDGYSREIELVPSHERSTRLLGELRQLHAGLVVNGTPDSEVWRLLAQVALGGIHPGRRSVIDYLISAPGDHTTVSIAGHCLLTISPTQRHLEDLTAHGVVEFIGDHPKRWTASEWLRDQWWAVSGPEPFRG